MNKQKYYRRWLTQHLSKSASKVTRRNAKRYGVMSAHDFELGTATPHITLYDKYRSRGITEQLYARQLQPLDWWICQALVGQFKFKDLTNLPEPANRRHKYNLVDIEFATRQNFNIHMTMPDIADRILDIAPQWLHDMGGWDERYVSALFDTNPIHSFVSSVSVSRREEKFNDWLDYATTCAVHPTGNLPDTEMFDQLRTVYNNRIRRQIHDLQSQQSRLELMLFTDADFEIAPRLRRPVAQRPAIADNQPDFGF